MRHCVRMADSPRICAIINPASGRGAGASSLAAIKQAIETSSSGDGARIELTSPLTSGPWRSTAYALARRAADDGFDRIIAVGGDGTLHEVANGIIGSETTLGLVPMGTGNDFARTVGISGNVEACLDHALNAEPVWIDCGKAGDRCFLNVAGCGFDAVVAERINRGFRFLKGTSAYIAAVLRTLADYKAAPLRIVTESETHTVDAMLCAIGNARFYGGGMKIAPYADLTDGMFDLTVIEKIGKIGFLKAFPSVFKGAHVSNPKYFGLRCRRVRIESDRELPVLVDGELLGTTPVEFEAIPNALKFALPSGHSLRRP